MTKAKPIPPEVIDRSAQHIADHILNLANTLGETGRTLDINRKRFGLPDNPAYEVQEMSARMGIWLAIEIAEGRLVPGIYKSK